MIKTNRIVSAVALLTFLIGGISVAETYMESVLKDGFGVRPLGMGGAFTAVADDSNAVYYNPAGIAEITTQFTKGYLDMNTDSYDVNDCFSLAANQVGVAGWNKWDKSFQKVSVSAYTFATKGDNNISWGITYKTIAWSLSGNDNKGWTLDAGIKAQLTQELRAGVLFQDLMKNTAPISTTLRIGGALVPLSSKDSIIACDAELKDLKSEKGATIKMHYGIEHKLTTGLIVRGGWANEQWTAGATATFPYITIDYALIVNKDSKNTQMFGFRVSEK